MSDVNDKPKKDDCGMTVPHPHPDIEKGADNFSDDFASPDLNKPNSQPFSWDSDKITPNINIPKDVRQDETPPTPNQPPTEDWEITGHNIIISRQGKPTDGEVAISPVNNPKQKKKDDWSMPEPVFRVSEGESLEEVAKRTPIFNLKDIEDFGKTNPNFNFSEVSPPEPFNQTVPNLNLQPQPDISDSFSAGEIAIENNSPVRPNNYKAIFIVVGLFSMLLFAGAVVFGLYLLFLKNQ